MIPKRRTKYLGQPFRRHPAGVCRLLLLVFLVCFSATFARAAGRTFHGHVPPAVRSLTPLRSLDPAQHLGLVITLPLRNPEDLTNLLQSLYDPAGTNYRHFLTTEQFTERFGPVPADYQKVADFMTSHGLAVTHTYANRVLLDVDGSVADVERTFHVNLHVFNHPTESRTFFAPDADPALDVDLPVLDVDGLDNFVLPRPASLKLTPAGKPGTARPNNGSAPDGSSYIGSDFRTAYLPGVTLNGTGQVVALFELDGYFPTDITTYEGLANLPNVPLTNILLDGYDGSANNNNIEVALDIDMAICMAPGLTGVLVYEGTEPNDVLNQMAIDNRAKQLSCSWAWSGFSNVPPVDQIFMEYAAQGQSFFAAAGDSGAYVGTNTIMTPSDDPNITIVGGTTLTTDIHVSYVSETVWNWFPRQADASSGGVSQTYPIPSWQQGIDMTANLGSTNNRNIPDVAFTADNIYLIADHGLTYVAGGTSAAAPLWAGLTALINQQAVASGESNVGFLNPALYTIAKGPNYLANFHDITAGNNFNATSSPYYPATTGFDLCTGWGTPAGTNLINSLAFPVHRPLLVADGAVLAAENCLPTNDAIDPGETVTVDFKLQNVGSAATTNLVATLLTNANVSPSGTPQTYGVVSSNGATSSRPFTFTASGFCGEPITASLQLQDGPTNLGTLNFPFTLGVGVGGVTTFSQNFDGVPAPLLPSGWSSSHSGGEPAWVTSTASRDTSPNAAFAKENSQAGLTQLISPAIAINLPIAQVKFRHSYNTDSGYDGGILTISINGGPYQDILAAGGSFATNGYTGTLGNTSGNPIGGFQAWTGASGGFITTIVNLPASAAGQTIRLNWQFGTDEIQGGSGWYVDTISVLDGSYTCCTATANSAPVITVQPTNVTVAAGATAVFSVSATGTPAPVYHWFRNVTNSVGGNSSVLTLPAVQPSQAGSYTVLVTNVAGATNSTPATLTVLVSPLITTTTVVRPNVSLSFPSLTGLNYTLQYKNLLSDSNWTTLTPSTPGTGATLTLHDTNALPATRFYRILCD